MKVPISLLSLVLLSALSATSLAADAPLSSVYLSSVFKTDITSGQHYPASSCMLALPAVVIPSAVVANIGLGSHRLLEEPLLLVGTLVAIGIMVSIVQNYWAEKQEQGFLPVPADTAVAEQEALQQLAVFQEALKSLAALKATTSGSAIAVQDTLAASLQHVQVLIATLKKLETLQHGLVLQAARQALKAATSIAQVPDQAALENLEALEKALQEALARQATLKPPATLEKLQALKKLEAFQEAHQALQALLPDSAQW